MKIPGMHTYLSIYIYTASYNTWLILAKNIASFWENALSFSDWADHFCHVVDTWKSEGSTDVQSHYSVL